MRVFFLSRYSLFINGNRFTIIPIDYTHDSVVAIIDFLQQFCGDLGIPTDLAALGLDDGRAGEIGALALEDPSAAGNPRELDADQYATLYRAALAGDFSLLDGVR